MGLIEHAKYELKLAGYNMDDKSEDNYAGIIGRAALDLIELFAKQGHSGFSSNVTLQIFNRLARFKPLTNELSDNPDEWNDITEQCSGEPTWQSKRNPSCFSHDMKTYYDIDDPDNNVYEKDDEGNLTGYACLKAKSERKMLEMTHDKRDA